VTAARHKLDTNTHTHTQSYTQKGSI